MMERTTVLIVILIWLSLGCTKEDNESPTISGFSVNGSDSSLLANAGDTLLVQAQFEDNEELLQYRFEVAQGQVKTFQTIDHIRVGPLDGTTKSVAFSYQLPDSGISGLYLANMEALDQSGNRSEQISIPFILWNDGQPVVTLNTPDLGATITLSQNDTLFFAGSITDDTDLDRVCIDLEDLYSEDFLLTDTVITLWDFNQMGLQERWLIIPPETLAGIYTLVLLAEDNDGHQTVHTGIITVVD